MKEKSFNIPLIGGLIAGIAASICCIGPLVLLLLGISGTWISHLTAFEAYRPYLMLLSLGFLGFAYWKIFIPSKKSNCKEGDICFQENTKQKHKILFWIVSLIVFVSLVSPYAIPLFF